MARDTESAPSLTRSTRTMTPHSLLPSAFRPPVAIRMLASLATAAALAAVFGSVMFAFLGAVTDDVSQSIPTSGASTTFVAALVWMVLLRTTPSWVAIALSVVLAAGNSFAALALATKDLEHLRECLFLSVGYGAFLWFPSLLVSWLVFGLPTLSARSAARRGLTAIDTREALIGGIASSAGLLAAAVVYLTIAFYGPTVECSDEGVILAFGIIAMLGGGLTLIGTGRRKDARERFVAAVGRGAIAGVRIDVRGKATKIVLDGQMDKSSYRVAPARGEVVAELDEPLVAVLTSR